MTTSRLLSVTLTGLLLTMASALAYAKAEYSKKEKTACATCHVQKVPKKDDKATHGLNDKGKCYEKSHSMANCK